MEYLLVDRDQWVVMKPDTAPAGMSQEDWEKFDRK